MNFDLVKLKILRGMKINKMNLKFQFLIIIVILKVADNDQFLNSKKIKNI